MSMHIIIQMEHGMNQNQYTMVFKEQKSDFIIL